MKANKDKGTSVGFSNLEVKNHYLKSIQDIYDILNEDNIDFFLEDFRLFALDCVKAKLINKLANSMAGGEDTGLQIEHFHWIEDGKHDNHGTYITATDGKNSITIDINDMTDKIHETIEKTQIMNTVCKEHEWVEVANAVKEYILSTGNEVNETTIAYAIVFSKKWDNLTGKDAAEIRNLLLVRPTPTDFKIEDNLKVIEGNKWEDIWDEYNKIEGYRHTAIFFKKYLQENFVAPEKK